MSKTFPLGNLAWSFQRYEPTSDDNDENDDDDDDDEDDDDGDEQHWVPVRRNEWIDELTKVICWLGNDDEQMKFPNVETVKKVVPLICTSVGEAVFVYCSARRMTYPFRYFRFEIAVILLI